MALKFNPFTNKLDITEVGGGGSGDVTGPGSSTNNAIVRWDGITGTLIKNSVAILSDAGDIMANSIDLTIPVAADDGGTGIASYTIGDILYASGATTLSKLAIGSNNQVLTVSAGVPTWATPAASGTVSSFSFTDGNGFDGTVINSTTTPALSLATTVGTNEVIYANAGALTGTGTGQFVSELRISSTGVPILNTTPTNDIAISEDDFYYYSQQQSTVFYIIEGAGNGSDSSFNTSTVTATAFGESQLFTGTDTNGCAQISVPGNAQSKPVFLGNGVHQLDFLVRVPVLSDGTETYSVVVGIGENFSANARNAPGPNHGVYFTYSSSVSPNWIGASKSSGSITTASGGGSVVVTTDYMHLRITINAAATLCTFFVNGTNVGTTAADIPTTALGMGCQILKSAGTTGRFCLLDYWRHAVQMTTSRFS